MMPLDTAHVARATEGVVTVNIALISMGLAMAGLIVTVVGIVYRMGQQNGRQEEKNTTHERELRELKAAAQQAITREELDARFEMMSALLTAMKERLTDLADLLRRKD